MLLLDEYILTKNDELGCIIETYFKDKIFNIGGKLPDKISKNYYVTKNLRF